MGTFARAQRRKVKHAYGLKTDAQAEAILTAIANESQVKAEKIKATRILEIARPKMEEEMRAAISSECLVLVASFLRVKHGYGKARLHRAVQEFMDFTEDMGANKTTVPMLIEMLKDETGYDLLAHAQEMGKEVIDNGKKAG